MLTCFYVIDYESNCTLTVLHIVNNLGITPFLSDS